MHTFCRLSLLVAVLATFTVSCYVPPARERPPEVVHKATNPQFDKLRENLIDIVVLATRPPEGDPRSDGPHLRRFRRLVYQGLIEKGYSPLKLTYIDQVGAGETLDQRSDPDHNLSRFEEDAIMALSLNDWSRDWARQEGVVMVSASMALIRSKDKESLWKHEIRHRFYKIPRNADDHGLTVDEMIVDRVVKDLLAEFPGRA